MKKYRVIIFLLSLILSLTACGGGGGKNPDSVINNYNVNLQDLGVSDGVLVFDPDKTAYDLEVSSSLTSVTVFSEAVDTNCTIKVNGSAIKSGGSISIGLTGNPTMVNVVVTAPDNTTTKTYTISITRTVLSSNANLADLKISDGILSTPFDKDTISYDVDVAYSVDHVTVIPVTAGENSTVKVNGSEVVSGEESQDIGLSASITNITVTVTAQNGDVKEYKISVNRHDGITNANLADLTLSAGELSGGFNPNEISYTALVLYSISAITVRPTAAWGDAVIKVINGAHVETVKSGTSSSLIALEPGSNTIMVEVTAENNSVKTYMVSVYRTKANINADLAKLTISTGNLTPAFDGNTTGYNVSVPYVTDSITVTPTTSESTSIVTVNNVITGSGNASQPIALNEGTNTITVCVVAESGITKTYTIVVGRTTVNTNSSLSSLTISTGTLSPSFTANNTGYKVSIPYVTTGIRVTPTVAGYNAAVTVNGAAIASGTQTGIIALSMGVNTITIVVTAEDNSTKTYTITVTRADVNTNCNLANLTISSGTLSSQNTTSYTAEIAYTVTSIRVTPTVEGYNAAVKVNGTAVNSGADSENISMAVGSNTIIIVVTAENGTTKTYTVTVNRIAASTNANLANLSISAGTLDLVFDQTVISYNAIVPYANTAVTVTPSVAGLNATVRVNGKSVTSGTASSDINLSLGDNSIIVVVTAESGAVKTYTIVAHRLSNNAYLSSVTISQGMMPQFSSTINAYIIDVHETISSICVNPTTSVNSASVTVNGLPVSSGTFSDEISLSTGKNTISIVVSAEDGTINTYYLIVYKLNLFNFIISGKGTHTMLLKTDGTLWATGVNDHGQFGDGTTESKTSFTQVMTGVSKVYTSDYNTLALKTDGTLWATGYNYYGQLGDGTKTSKTSFTQIMTEVSNVYLNNDSTMMLKSDGTLWVTGRNDYGQLGDGTNIDRCIPVQVLENVIHVSVSGSHTVVLKGDGTLWGMGSNSLGELGDGTTILRSTPIKIMDNVSYASAIGKSTEIIKTDGTLWATGNNSYGNLGDGTYVTKYSPVQIMTDVKYIETRSSCTFILKTDGTLWSTGYNVYGQLGIGSTKNIYTPVRIMSDVASVSSDGTFTTILKTDGTLWATGYNENGQLGDGTLENKLIPVLINTNVKRMILGACNFIQKIDGTFWVTGYDAFALFGNGTTTSTTTFIQLPW